MRDEPKNGLRRRRHGWLADFVGSRLSISWREFIQATAWHEIFAGVYFCGLAIVCVLLELIFAIKTDWFFLLGINFCDFQNVPSTQN